MFSIFGVAGIILQFAGYPVPYMPIWAWLLIIFIGLYISQFLAFHKVRVQRDALQDKQSPKQIDLAEQLHSLVEEGRNLRILSVSQGEPPPILMAENWRIRVEQFLHSNFGKRQSDIWNAHTIGGKPKQGFTGMATRAQIDLWNKLTAGIEWLEEFQNQIRATPSTLKSPHPPELHVSYQKHEFGVDNGVPIITVWAEYRPTGTMRIEAIELQLLGRSEPSLDWEVYEVKQDVWIISDTKFKVPDGISLGEHNVTLAAFANGEWWGSHPFTIAFPEVNS